MHVSLSRCGPNIFVNRYLLLAHIDLSERRSHGTHSFSTLWVVKVFACVRACRDRLNYLYDSDLFCTTEKRHRSGKRERTKRSSNPNKFGDLSLALRETLIKDIRFLLTSLTCKLLSLTNNKRQVLN